MQRILIWKPSPSAESAFFRSSLGNLIRFLVSEGQSGPERTVHRALRNRAVAGSSDVLLYSPILWLYDYPAGIGIEEAHCGCDFGGGLAQVFLEEHAVLVHHEGHDA
jgi:hypothetical protein